jgi:hypothetical protein
MRIYLGDVSINFVSRSLQFRTIGSPYRTSREKHYVEQSPNSMALNAKQKIL